MSKFYKFYQENIKDDEEDYDDLWNALEIYYDEVLKGTNRVSEEGLKKFEELRNSNEVIESKQVLRSFAFLHSGILLIPDDVECKEFVDYILKMIKNETGFSKFARRHFIENNEIVQEELISAINRQLDPLLKEGKIDAKAKAEFTKKNLAIYNKRLKYFLDAYKKITA